MVAATSSCIPEVNNIMTQASMGSAISLPEFFRWVSRGIPYTPSTAVSVGNGESEKQEKILEETKGKTHRTDDLEWFQFPQCRIIQPDFGNWVGRISGFLAEQIAKSCWCCHSTLSAIASAGKYNIIGTKVTNFSPPPAFLITPSAILRKLRKNKPFWENIWIGS